MLAVALYFTFNLRGKDIQNYTKGKLRQTKNKGYTLTLVILPVKQLHSFAGLHHCKDEHNLEGVGRKWK